MRTSPSQSAPQVPCRSAVVPSHARQGHYRPSCERCGSSVSREAGNAGRSKAHPSPTLPFATRKGGSCSRRSARGRELFLTICQREGAVLDDLPEGESSPQRPAKGKELLSTIFQAAAKAAFTPSLSRSEGEGWGGVSSGKQCRHTRPPCQCSTPSCAAHFLLSSAQQR